MEDHTRELCRIVMKMSAIGASSFYRNIKHRNTHRVYYSQIKTKKKTT